MDTPGGLSDSMKDIIQHILASPVEAHEMLGRLYEQKGQTDDALGEYEAAVRVRPDMSQAQLDLGAVLSKKGDIAGAAVHLKLASEAADPSGCVRSRSICCGS